MRNTKGTGRHRSHAAVIPTQGLAAFGILAALANGLIRESESAAG